MPTTPHSQLTGADLHEPKGAASATSGQIYVADGAGSGAWTNPSASTPFTTIRKTASTSRSNTTTLAADPHLFFSTQANKRYYIQGLIFIYAPANPDFKFRWNGPASISSFRTHETWTGVNDQLSGNLTAPTNFPGPTTSIVSSTDQIWHLNLNAVLVTGASTGTFALEWAQNSSNATAVQVLAESYIEYRIIT